MASRQRTSSWFVSGKEVFIGNELPVKVERLDPPPPFGQEKPHLVRLVSEGKLGAALVAGDSGYPALFGGGVLPGVMGEVPGVKPLFEDTDEIIRYVKRTQIYPIIHIMTIKEETVEKYPDLAAKLIEAFREANRLAPKYFKNGDAAGYAKEREVLGLRSLCLCAHRRRQKKHPGAQPLSNRTGLGKKRAAAGEFIREGSV